MSLSFISAGIIFDLTLNGLKELKRCDKIYAEVYTSSISASAIKRLEKSLKKKITIIEREHVESNFLIEEAKKKKVALLVVGDALIATTHITLIIECRQKNIPIAIIHNSSIYSAAIGKSGLQAYRFGKSATLPYWKKNFEPTSSLEVVEENLKHNLHTLLFVDIDKELGPMDAEKGIESIHKIEERLGRKVISTLVILSQVGYPEEKISFGTPENLERKDLGKPLFTFIVPAKLHPLEEEYLNFFKA